MPAREDAELQAVEEVGRRAARLKTIILWPCVTIGALLGLGGYYLARELQFELWDMSFPWLSAVVGFALPLLASGALGLLISRLLTRRWRPGWIDEAARRHEVPREAVEQAFTRSL